MLVIEKVDKNGIGYELGLEKGDKIVSFNGFNAQDILDYLYYEAQTCFTVEIATKQGENVTLEVEKEEDESLGLTFLDDGLAIRTCHNNCLFCFVKQMPCGMRDSLYVKDDDYRQSFLCGNYVTLTNATDEDIDRIIRLNLSPLYISVHSLVPQTRVMLTSNPNAGKITQYLKKLDDAGIAFNAQIVLVKGINDGEDLTYTLNEFYKYKNIQSSAVVPCGITKYREGLFEIKDITKEYALEIIEQVESVNNAHNGALVCLADEFYLKAGLPLPSAQRYGNFAQIENGVGLTAKFLQDVSEILSAQKQVLPKGRYLTISGTSAHAIVCDVAKKVEQNCDGVSIKVVKVENKFFGSTVNCTGLLVGEDIYNALLPLVTKCDAVLIPNSCLRETEDVFLDGLTLEGLSKKLGKKVIRAVIGRPIKL